MSNKRSYKLTTFKQPRLLAWVWFALMGMSAFGTLLGVVEGLWGAAINNLVLCLGIFWIDQLEKEVTRHNIEQAPPNVETPDDAR